jgi:hypothetical protein
LIAHTAKRAQRRFRFIRNPPEHLGGFLTARRMNADFNGRGYG